MFPRRGEVYWASVTAAHATGREQFNEQDNPRAWLIVCDDRIPARLGIVVAVPLTTKIERNANFDMFRVIFEPTDFLKAQGDFGTPVGRQMLGEQIRVLDVVKRLTDLPPRTWISDWQTTARAARAALMTVVSKV